MEPDQQPKLGLVREPSEIYHASEALSAHGIMEIVNRSPKHFHWKYVQKKEVKETEALTFGRILHTSLLEPKVFSELVFVAPEVNKRTNAGKQQYAEWLESLPQGAIVITKDQRETISAMIDSLHSHPVAGEMLKNGIPEISGYFEREGIRCKFRPDYLHPKDRMVIDLKSTRDASMEKFRRDIVNYGWDIQSAWYTEAFRYLPNVGKPAEAFSFIAIEKEAPFGCAVYIADETVIGRGKVLCDRGFYRYKECMEKNRWPDYQTGAENINVPYWALWSVQDEV